MTRKEIVATKDLASEGPLLTLDSFVLNYYLFLSKCDFWAVNNFEKSTFVFI